MLVQSSVRKIIFVCVFMIIITWLGEKDFKLILYITVRFTVTRYKIIYTVSFP